MPYSHLETERLSLEEHLQKLKVDQLKPLARLLTDDPPPRKPELLGYLAKRLLDREKLRLLYESLPEIDKSAVQEAVHDEDNRLDLDRFEAKYGNRPGFGSMEAEYGKPAKPLAMDLFFPYSTELPGDLGKLLRSFVPEPREAEAAASDALPESLAVKAYVWENGQGTESEESIPLRVRETAREALHDVHAVLRLIDLGQVRVSEKTRRPGDASMKAVTSVLSGGEYYTAEDASQEDWSAAHDLKMKSFAWPLLLQAAKLVELSGSKLRLTPAGRKANQQSASIVLREIWTKWRDTTLFDEFSRISVIKGQQAKGRGLTPVAPRREAVADLTAELPIGRWLAMTEVFRFMKASPIAISITHDPWKLYIADPQYGSLGYEGYGAWEMLQGSYVRALFFEYMATLGMLDVAYLPPVASPVDMGGQWGTDDLACLSRYDGLQYVRVTGLGGWCLGVSESYEPEPVARELVFKVLPNLDVVAAQRRPAAADLLFLERFAERRSDSVWRLDRTRMLAALEQGLSTSELREFLVAKSSEPLPQTADVFLGEIETRAGALKDAGLARRIECADAPTAHLIVSDRRMRNLCQLASERYVVFGIDDEAAVRRGLRELGYVLPGSRS